MSDGGRPIIRVRISAPSGAGKSTLARMMRDYLTSQQIPVIMPGRLPRHRDEADHSNCIEALRRRGTIIQFMEQDRQDE